MASYPIIADNEMNYFQFKARQLLLLKKEDQEWQKFCKQVAPECTACLAESINSKESKDIGIQANPRPSFKKFERPSVHLRQQDEHIPEALSNIRARLENIDLTLSKIYSVPDEREKRKIHEETLSFRNTENLKLFEGERRHFIQNSLKTSLEKLDSFPLKVNKKPPTIKPKNSSYFLPHDLQVKRAASRKAYLASMQTKPKVSIQNERQITKKATQVNQNKKVVVKQPPKSRKKIVIKKVTKPSNVERDTLIACSEAGEVEDENIEFIVDAILEDLLGEAGLDLNRVKERKRERILNTLQQTTHINKEREISISSKSLTASSIKNTEPKVSAYSDSESQMKLKEFHYSSMRPHQSDIEKTVLVTEGAMQKTSIFHSEYLTHGPEKSSIGKSSTDILLPQQYSTTEDPPKFVCDVLHSITVNPEKARDIMQNKKRYWRYLKNISRTVKGDFNPWVLNSMLAESILDDCINDIAEELSDVPSTFIQDLYNQEFIQQVQK